MSCVVQYVLVKKELLPLNFTERDHSSESPPRITNRIGSYLITAMIDIDNYSHQVQKLKYLYEKKNLHSWHLFDVSDIVTMQP